MFEHKTRGLWQFSIVESSGFAQNVDMTFQILRLLLIVFIAVVAGCSQQNQLGRRAIEGEVTLNGIALPHGTILCAPDGPGGVSSGGEIADGQYAIPAHQGLLPGVYTVRIYAADQQAEAVEPALPGPGIRTQPETIPAQYNMRSRLKLTVPEAEGSNEPVRFDIDMQSK